jgi:hypothetical protein
MTATFAAAVAVIAAGVLGVATAEGPSSVPPRTVSVQGISTEAIDQNATSSAATAVYRRGMSDAASDGATKAQFLAGRVGANLGAVQSVVEDGGYISCASETEYQGEQPDFGSASASLRTYAFSSPARGSAPAARKVAPRHHHKTPAAKKANVPTCTLSAQVSLVYALT